MDIEESGREFARGLSIGARAAALGHEGHIEQDGKRIRIVCSCGESSNPRWTRKRTFQWIHDHCVTVVRQSGEFTDTPKDVHNNVSGRA